MVMPLVFEIDREQQSLEYEAAMGAAGPNRKVARPLPSLPWSVHAFTPGPCMRAPLAETAWAAASLAAEFRSAAAAYVLV